MDEHEKVDWAKLTSEFVLERRNKYINEFILKVHESKKKSEADFKF